MRSRWCFESNMKPIGVCLVAMGLSIFGGRFANAEGTKRDTTGDGRSALPRYQLQVGEVLVYESIMRYSGRESKYGGRDTIWVVGKNGDGSHRLVVRHEFWTEGNEADPERRSLDDTLAYFDLHPDGRFDRNESFGYRFDAGTLFPLLPPDALALTRGWESEAGRYGNSYDFEITERPDDPQGIWRIRGMRKGPTNEVYEASETVDFRFDPERGLIDRIDRMSTQSYSTKSEGEGALTLVSVETVNADWLQTFREQTDRYFDALAKYLKLEKRARHEYSLAVDLTKQAFDSLKDVRSEITLPEIESQLDAYLKNEERYSEHNLERARKFEALIGHSSEDWELEDLDGNRHSLSDYRGRVVLLDFWYRGCGWCIRAMPQVKQVTKRFADRPVTVFGMNTDRELENARFVEQAMKLNYLSLQADGIPEKYEVTGFPTLVILDRHGRIRDFHVGYADDLFEQVSASVERLLQEPGEAEVPELNE